VLFVGNLAAPSTATSTAGREYTRAAPRRWGRRTTRGPFADHERTPGGYGSHWRARQTAALPAGPAAKASRASTSAKKTSALVCPPFPRGAGRSVRDRTHRRQRRSSARTRVASGAAKSCPLVGSCFFELRRISRAACAPSCVGTGGADTECGKIAILRDFKRVPRSRNPLRHLHPRQRRGRPPWRACDARPRLSGRLHLRKKSELEAVAFCIPPYFLFQLRVDGHLL